MKPTWMAEYLERRRERRMHNDLDANCRFWWGDRAGSLQARCPICAPSSPPPRTATRERAVALLHDLDDQTHGHYAVPIMEVIALVREGSHDDPR